MNVFEFLTKNSKNCALCNNKLIKGINKIIEDDSLTCSNCNLEIKFEYHHLFTRHLYNNNLIGCDEFEFHIWLNYNYLTDGNSGPDIEYFNKTYVNSKEDYFKLIDKVIKEYIFK